MLKKCKKNAGLIVFAALGRKKRGRPETYRVKEKTGKRRK